MEAQSHYRWAMFTALTFLLVGLNIAAIFYLSERSRVARAALSLREEQVRRGAATFVANCATCHGEDGKQTSVKEFPKGIEFEVIAGKDAAWLAKTLKEYRGGIKEKDYQPLNKYGYGAAMKGPTVDLSWKEIDALAEYVSKMK